jgi:ribonucleotide reductase alpha subunit
MAKNTITLKNPDGAIVFMKEDFEYPDSWSLQAATTFARYYTLTTEHSVNQALDRILSHFPECHNKAVVKQAILEQKASPNSPVLFNFGTCEKPLGSACFILNVQDDMDDIGELYKKFMSIYKYGAGAGINPSNLRASMEKLSRSDGVASGPLSFMEVADCIAKVVRSGGRQRRAAKGIWLDCDHPDIEMFIDAKWKEEDKARVLEAAGYGSGMESESYNTVAFQNVNMSVRLTDAFMKAVEEDGEWNLTARKDGSVVKTVRARELMMKIAEAAHKCGDPGVQFHDTINRANPFRSLGKEYQINASNPCISGDTYCLTDKGIRQIKDLVGEVVNILHPSGDFVPARIYKTKTAPTMEAKTAGGLSCYTTTEHLWLTEDGDIETQNLLSKNLEIRVHSVSFGECRDLPLFKQAGENYSTHELIPNTIMRGSSEELCCFLRAVFDKHAHVIASSGRIACQVNNASAAKQFQVILGFLGIRSTFFFDVKSGFHRIEIADIRSINRFRRSVGSDKDDNMNKMLLITSCKYEHSDRDCVRKVVYSRRPEDVYDFTILDEKYTPYGVFNGGVVLHNCSEFMFLDNSACNLASVNLNKFYDGNTFDIAGFTSLCKELIFAMDMIIDIASYPTDEIAANSVKFRPLGLGYTGLGTVLMRMGLPYGSPGALEFVELVTREMTRAAWETSNELYSLFGANLSKKEQDALTDHVRGILHDSQIYGFRNSQVTLLAPTGTISFIMDTGDSTGIEPVVAIEANKTVIGGQVIKVLAKGAEEALKKTGAENFDHPVFATSIGKNCVSVDAHLATMEAAQKFVSGSISKTINLPFETTPQQIFDLYVDAWKRGIKAVAIYRAGSKMNEPLKVKADPAKEPSRTRLPRTRMSRTHHFEVMGVDGYLTIGYYDDGRIGEVFCSMQKTGSTVQGLLNSFSIMMSNALQYGVPIEDIIRKFKGTMFDPAGITDNPDIPICSSILDYVVRYIETTLGKPIEESEVKPSVITTADDDIRTCPECGNVMTRKGRCHICNTCGASGGCS